MKKKNPKMVIVGLRSRVSVLTAENECLEQQVVERELDIKELSQKLSQIREHREELKMEKSALYLEVLNLRKLLDPPLPSSSTATPSYYSRPAV